MGRRNALVRFGQNRIRTFVSMATDSFHRAIIGKSYDYSSASIFMPLTLKKWGHIGFGLYICMYVFLSVSVCMYVFLSVRMDVCMYACMYICKLTRKRNASSMVSLY